MSNLIPENVYRLKVVRAEFGETTGKGTPYARVTVEIVDEGEHAGRRVAKDLWFTDKTWSKSVETLRALGWQGDDITALQSIIGALGVGKVVQELVTDRDGQVKTNPQGNAIYRNEVAWLGKDNAPKAMEAGKLSSFRELMRARIQQLGGAPASAPQKTDDSDIPF